MNKHKLMAAQPALAPPHAPPSTSASGACVAGWQSLLDALPVPAWVAELQTRRLLAVNTAAARLYTRTAGQLLQETSDTLVSSPEDQAWWCEASAGGATQAPDALHSDTVIATLASLVAAGLSLRDAMPHANRAGGIVVGKFGTATVTYAELFG